ncbi:MAG: large conductance mechanosensitive channel protein MscL [Clostridia bacterium]|nr:large conductance mechanosensitive channel protein MscL [Clostridia bacterium]
MGKEDREAMDKKIKEGEKNVLKEKRKKMKEGSVSFWSDFKAFITKGNVLDMAVAVVVASAFNAIVNGLVKNIITPFVTYLTSGVSIDEWEIVLRPEEVVDGVVTTTKIAISYGLWLQAIVDFIIIAFSVFVVVRAIRKAERRLNAKEIAAKEAAAAKKKAEEDAAAAAKAAADQAAADEKKRIEDEFHANIKEQSELLRAILEQVKK